MKKKITKLIALMLVHIHSTLANSNIFFFFLSSHFFWSNNVLSVHTYTVFCLAYNLDFFLSLVAMKTVFSSYSPLFFFCSTISLDFQLAVVSYAIKIWFSSSFFSLHSSLFSWWIQFFNFLFLFLKSILFVSLLPLKQIQVGIISSL